MLPEWQLEGLLEDYEHYAGGEPAAVVPTADEITGQEPRDIARFARDYAACFSGPGRLIAAEARHRMLGRVHTLRG